MTLLIRAAVICIVALFHPAIGHAQATAPYAECVQRALTALGHDPGGIDGQLGPKTRAAAQAAQQDRDASTDLQTLTQLNRFTVVSWCRALSTQAGHDTPGGTTPRVRVADTNGPEPALLMAELVAEARGYYAKTYGRSLTGTFDLVAGGNPDNVFHFAKQIQAEKNVRILGIKSKIYTVCGNTGQETGFAIPAVIFLCWPPVLDHSAAWRRITLPRIAPTMVHEMMHLFQTELANETKPQRNRQKAGLNVGPHWMVEGTAMVMELRYLATQPLFDTPSLRILQEVSARHKTPLGQLQAQGAVTTRPHYLLSHFAAHLLAERHGIDTMFDYWQAIGQGQTWEDAFEQVFDQTLASFEADFEIMRHDLAAAKRFSEVKTDR